MTYPCRVAVETRQHLEKQAQNEQYARDFNPWDDADMKAVCGERLWKPVRGLLFLLTQIRHVEQSFGTADKCKAFDALRLELDALEAGCKDAWKDL